MAGGGAYDITRKNTHAYDFDSANRVTSVGVINPNQTISPIQTYRYDGLGRRVLTTDADGKTTFWQYSRAGQVIYASEARKSRNTDYIYLGNTQVAQRHMAWGTGTITVEYQHTDALGSPVAQTNASGQVIERTDYNPWGEVYAGGAVDGPGYTGHVMDAATGLIYMQQRFYDPEVGRFPSNDPVPTGTHSGANFNRYWYANDNSYRFIDPDGRAPNQAGTTDPAHFYFALKEHTLLQISNSHGGNMNRYFYTETWGWIDIRHFAKAASMVQQGTHPELVRTLGFGNEVVQWGSEWGDAYRSGFSPEDLASNAAGIEFGRMLSKNQKGRDLQRAFLLWAKANRAHRQGHPEAARDQLPEVDPSARGGEGRGSDSNSAPPEDDVIEPHQVKVNSNCGKVCSMRLRRESRKK